MLLRRSIRGLLKSQPILYGLTAAGVALGVAAVVSIQIINQNALATFSASVSAVSLGADVIVRAAETPLNETLVGEVLSDPGVRAAQPVHKVEAAYFPDPNDQTNKIYIDILGLDLAAPGRLPLEGATDSLSQILSVRGWAAPTPELAEDLGFALGDRFEVVAGTLAASLRVEALVDFRKIAPLAATRLVVMDIAQSQDLFDERGIIDEINVFVYGDDSPSQVAERLQTTLGSRAAVTTPNQKDAEAKGLLAAFRLNLTALSLISLLVGLFLVQTSVQASLVRRRSELGVLRSLGATKGQTLRLLLIEAAVVGLVGTVVGLPIGFVAAHLNVDAVSGTLRDIYLLEEIEQLVVPIWIYVLAGVLGLGGAMLGSLLPAWDAVNREPRELLGRVSANEHVSRLAPKLALVGGAISVGAVGWYATFGQATRYGGFVLAIALLLFIPAVSPLALRLFASIAPASKLGGGYAVRTLQSSRAQTSGLTVAALGIAFSMLVSITFMIGSFRATLDVWIDRVVVADVYLSTATSERGTRLAGFSPSIVERLKARPGIRYLDTIRRREGEANGRSVRVVGVDLSLPNTVERFPLLDGDAVGLTEQLLAGNSVLITEPLARKSNTWAGDTVSMQTRNGLVKLQVAGVFFDYSTEKGVVYMDRSVFARLFGAGEPMGIALYLDESSDAEQTVNELRQELTVPGLYVRSNRTLRERVFQIFEQTFAIVRLLQAMSLLIAAFGIALTLFVIARERIAELALYRALGATRRQVFGFFLGKGVALGGLGTALGLVGGVVLAGILIWVINRELFGWTIQVYVPWASLAEQVLTIIGVAVLAAAIPALRASKTPAGELTRDAL